MVIAPVLASDGRTAVTTYVARSTEIAAVITDLHMPFMGGADTIAVLRRYNPDVKIIVSTAADPDRETGAEQVSEQAGTYERLTKPFDTEALLAALHRVLRG